MKYPVLGRNIGYSKAIEILIQGGLTTMLLVKSRCSSSLSSSKITTPLWACCV